VPTSNPTAAPRALDAAHVRRGALFLINIGAPFLVGILLGQPQSALVGAVVGMLLAFADTDGGVVSRLRLLMLDAGAIAAGGVAGYLVRNSSAILWPLFLLVTFAVGLAARGGREPLLAGRHGAMAFAVAATIPTFTVQQIWYLGGALALNAVSRAVDHLIAGPLPLQPAAPLQKPSQGGGWLMFACAFAFASTLALRIGSAFDPTHRFWIVITTLVVMQPDASASYRRIVERVVGTFAGVVVAGAITLVFHSAFVIAALVLALAPLIPHHLASRYWLHTALIAVMVLLAYDLAELNSQDFRGLLLERLQDILLGCAMALVGTTAAFPREALAELRGIATGHADQK
jgi:uncharacterized membrane protein YccC